MAITREQLLTLGARFRATCARGYYEAGDVLKLSRDDGSLSSLFVRERDHVSIVALLSDLDLIEPEPAPEPKPYYRNQVTKSGSFSLMQHVNDMWTLTFHTSGAHVLHFLTAADLAKLGDEITEARAKAATP